MDYMQLARMLFGDVPDEQVPNMGQLTNSQAQPEEEINGQKMVDQKINQALNPRPAPNYFANQLRQGILDNKQAYMANQAIYDNPNSTDAAKTLAQQLMGANNASANRLRDMGQAAGLDMSQFGAGQSLEAGQSYLDSERARDIVEALQGAYSINSDQYYDKAYFNALSRGLSPRQAKRDAGMRAREYQANRVAYLNGVYNNYGHDGRVTNNIGNQILGMIAMENPMLANLYGQVYPNQRDAYARDNQLEDKVIDQTNALDLIGRNFQNTLTQMEYANIYNQQNKHLDALLELRNKVFLGNIEAQAELDKLRYASEQEQNKFLAQARQAHQIARMLGFEENTDAYRAIVFQSLTGKTMPNLDKGAFNKDLTNGLNTFIETTGKQIEEIRERLTDTTLTDEERRSLETRLTDLMNGRNAATDKMGEALGTQVRVPIPPFTNNPDKDLPIIRALIEGMPKDSKREDILHDIVHYIQDSQQGKSISEAAIEHYLIEQGLLPPREEKAQTETSQATKNNPERARRASTINTKVNTANYLYNPDWVSK